MADRLAGGDLGARMPGARRRRDRGTQRSFNVMAGSLATSRDELASLLASRPHSGAWRPWSARGARPGGGVRRDRRGGVRAAGARTPRRSAATSPTRRSACWRWRPTSTSALRVGTRLTLEGDNAMGAVFRTGRAARQESYGAERNARRDRAQGAHRHVGRRADQGRGQLWGVVDRVLARAHAPRRRRAAPGRLHRARRHHHREHRVARRARALSTTSRPHCVVWRRWSRRRRRRPRCSRRWPMSSAAPRRRQRQ